MGRRVKSEPLLPLVIAHLKGVAADKNLALSLVADLAGVARSHFWEVMAARRSPTLNWIERVAAALEIAPASLFSEMPLSRAPFRSVTPRPHDRFRAALPLLPLAVAVKGLDALPENTEWVALREKRPLKPDMFVSRVVGRSMEPLILDGSFCLFQIPAAPPLNGKIALVHHRSLNDVDMGGSYTVRRIMQKKGGIDLLALNSGYGTIELRGKSAEQLAIVAELVTVL